MSKSPQAEGEGFNPFNRLARFNRRAPFKRFERLKRLELLEPRIFTTPDSTL